MYSQRTIDAIKRITPEQLTAAGVIALANDGKSYTCPACGNGTGESGDGIVPSDEKGIWTYHCFKCGASFDNIHLLARHYNLDSGKDFIEICRRACEDLSIVAEYDASKSTSYSRAAVPSDASPLKPVAPADEARRKKELELIHADILAAQANLRDLPEGARRGLKLETLKEFGCGFIGNWTSPKSRIAGTYSTPTPRLIIPTANHYLARLTVPLENFSESQRQHINPKAHAGKKELFNVAAIDDAISGKLSWRIIAVEGEIDAMSIWQATSGVVCTVACGGASSYKLIVSEIEKRVNLGGGIKTAKSKEIEVVILFDDDEAGHNNAEKLKQELLNLGVPAATYYFPADESKKLDANQILQDEGALFLVDTVYNKVLGGDDTEKQLKAAKNQIEMIRQAEMGCTTQPPVSPLDFSNLDGDARKRLWNKIRHLDFTNLDDAERLQIAFGEHIRWNTDSTCWGLYTNGTWNFSNSADSVLYPHARSLAEFIAANVPEPPPEKGLAYSSDMSAEEKAEIAKQIEEHKAKEKAYKRIKALERRWKARATITAAIDCLKAFHEIFVTDADLDAHPNLLNVRNGVIDLATGRLYPHSPELYMTRQAPVIYKPRLRPVRFQKFLEEILPDVATRAAVMRFLGYALTGEIREHAALFVKGSGANGKGTLFHLLLKILGDLATTMRFETFALRPVPRDADAPAPEFAKLVGRRLALIDELPENFRLDAATFKNTTGGDPLPYRRLHHDSDVIRNPVHKLIFCGNFLPDIRNAADPGLERRLRVVDFPMQFLGDKADKTLEATLSTEDEITGALTLFVEQAIQYYREGLLESPAMKKEKQDYLAQNDWLKDFVAENCVLGADKFCTRSEMLARLKEFSPARGLSERTLTNMIKKINGVSYGRSDGNGARRFTGIGLTDGE